MKYLKIKNSGEIEPQALTLIGASTKTDDNQKIGMFGSGNKYALAYILRNRIDLQIYSGVNRISIDTKSEIFREEEFEIVYINGERTSITTRMGKDWEMWQAIREVYCNAVDEGDETIEVVKRIEPVDGETHFYMEYTEEVKKVISDFDKYFSKDKAVVSETSFGKIMTKSHKTVNVYRKGIRCADTNYESVYDYDINEIHINESRVVPHYWRIQEAVWVLITQCKDYNVLENIFKGMGETMNIEHIESNIAHLNNNYASNEFKAYIYSKKLAPIELGGLLTESEQEVFTLIPKVIYNKIEEYMNPENKALCFGFEAGGEFFRPVTILTELQKATMRKAEEFFRECNYHIQYPIKVVEFRSKAVLGHAENKTIYVSTKAIDRGTNDLVNTIIEENVHLKYDVMDETRNMQTAIITEMITMMKTAYAFAL